MPPEPLERTDDPAVVAVRSTEPEPEPTVVIPEAGGDPSTGAQDVDPRAGTQPDPDAPPRTDVPEATGTWAATTERPQHAADPARRRRLIPWAVGACVLVVLGATAIGLSYTPLVEATRVSVKGEEHLTQGKVLRIARLEEGSNLIHADLAAAEQRLEQNPWILDATVERDLPHILRISVRERVPAAVTERPNGSLTFVAMDGMTMGAAPVSAGLPTVVAIDGEVPAPLEVLRMGASVAAAMPAGLRDRTASISVGADGSILLETATHIVVTYGDDSQLEAKGQTLKAVLDWSEREGVPLAAVDVTVPGAPTARRYGAPVDSQIGLSTRLG